MVPVVSPSVSLTVVVAIALVLDGVYGYTGDGEDSPFSYSSISFCAFFVSFGCFGLSFWDYCMQSL